MAQPDFPYLNHVFVLMLENHSFDHLLGFSGIMGTDAATGHPTSIRGLTGKEFNEYKGVSYTVSQPANPSMALDPGHEFVDALFQLTGSTVPYDPNKDFPPINNNGFVADYVDTLSSGQGHATDKFGEIMKCFSPEQLPVLTTLAKEFAVCDNWFSSMPGPTWPNRFFVHAASAGGLDHSPQTDQILLWENIGGLNFENGTLFDQLKSKFDFGYRLYRGDRFLSDIFPNVAALKGISCREVSPISDFDNDVNSGDYPWAYTFIEPSYGDILHNTYKGGTSQHPLDDITSGEMLIKQTYESIRKSPLWKKSMLLIIWDEHGGFYDHIPPPAAIAPGDNIIHPSLNKFGFNFKQYGVRVPAVVVSPLIPRNRVDHRLYDHSSVSATLKSLFGLESMTDRDANANSLFALLDPGTPARDDTPLVLPAPFASGLSYSALSPSEEISGLPNVPANKGSLPGFLQAALKADLEMSPEAEHTAIYAQFANIQTQDDAAKYMNKVKSKMETLK